MDNSIVTFDCPAPQPKTARVNAFLDKLLSYEQIVIFSPHLDDTMLSMGGLLTELVKSHSHIINYNIYTQCSPASTDSIALRLQLAGIPNWREYSQMRQAEDGEAFDALGGVEVHNLDFIDCLWRHNSEQQTLYHTAFSPVHEQDDHLQLLESTVKSLLTQPNTLAFCPIGRGNHIDHLIVRDIVSRSGVTVVYYMDFPYSQKYAEETDFISQHHLNKLEWPGPYNKKAELLQFYKSQHQSLFQPRPFPLDYEQFYFPFDL